MEDFTQSLAWLAPLIFGVLSWLAVKIRESEWGNELADRVGLKQREHEQDWEYQRRIGSFWFTIAAISGTVTYVMAQPLLEQQRDPLVFEMVVILLGAVIFLWSATKSIKAFWSSRRTV